MIKLGHLGQLESASKLETRYINNIVRKKTKQTKKKLLHEQFRTDQNKIFAITRMSRGLLQ